MIILYLFKNHPPEISNLNISTTLKDKINEVIQHLSALNRSPCLYLHHNRFLNRQF